MRFLPAFRLAGYTSNPIDQYEGYYARAFYSHLSAAGLKSRNYVGKYLASGKSVFLIGVEFSKSDRQIVEFEWEGVV